jgi:hypothetical protein
MILGNITYLVTESKIRSPVPRAPYKDLILAELYDRLRIWEITGLCDEYPPDDGPDCVRKRRSFTNAFQQDITDIYNTIETFRLEVYKSVREL